MKRILKAILVFVICIWAGKDSHLLNASNYVQAHSTHTAALQKGHRPKRPVPRNEIMNKRDFEFMYKVIKESSFDNDRLKLLSVGVLDNYFSCRQCAKILSIISLDSNKLKALEMMAEHLVDIENAGVIIDSFSFNSNKEKAFKLLLKPNRR